MCWVGSESNKSQCLTKPATYRQPGLPCLFLNGFGDSGGTVSSLSIDQAESHWGAGQITNSRIWTVTDLMIWASGFLCVRASLQPGDQSWGSSLFGVISQRIQKDGNNVKLMILDSIGNVLKLLHGEKCYIVSNLCFVFKLKKPWARTAKNDLLKCHFESWREILDISGFQFKHSLEKRP